MLVAGDELPGEVAESLAGEDFEVARLKSTDPGNFLNEIRPALVFAKVYIPKTLKNSKYHPKP